MSDRLSTSSAFSNESGVQNLSMHREIEFEEGSGEKEACVAPRLCLPQRNKSPGPPAVIHGGGTGVRDGERYLRGRRSRGDVDVAAPHASGEYSSTCGGREMQSGSEEQPRDSGSSPRVERCGETGGPARAGSSASATSSSVSGPQRTEDDGGSGATATGGEPDRQQKADEERVHCKVQINEKTMEVEAKGRGCSEIATTLAKDFMDFTLEEMKETNKSSQPKEAPITNNLNNIPNNDYPKYGTFTLTLIEKNFHEKK